MANQAKVAAIYAELQLQTAKFKLALNEATGEMRKFSAETRNQAREANGALATVGEQIGISLPRHVRAFVAQLPGVATAMNAAFDAVMVLALIHIIFEAGEKVVEFFKKSEEAANKNKEAWSKLSDSLAESTAKLAVGTDKIKDQIAQLEHKPKNYLKDAIDESRLATLDLNKQLVEAINNENQLLEKQGAGLLARVTGYRAGNESLQEKQSEYAKTQTTENILFQDALSKASTPEGAQKITQEHYGRVTRNTKNYWNELNGELQERERLESLRSHGGGMTDDRWTLEQKYGATGQESVIASLKGLMGSVGALGWNQDEQAQKYQSDAQLKGVQDSKTSSEQRLQQLEKFVERQKALHAMSLADEYMYWEKHLKGLSLNSDEYLKILQKASEAGKLLTENYSMPGKLMQSRQRAETASEDASVVNTGFRADESGGEQLSAVNARAGIASARNAEALTEAADKMKLATGAIDAHRMALDMAAAHTNAYNAELKAMEENLAALEQQNSFAAGLGFTDNKAIAGITEVQSQIATLTAQRKIQLMGDAQDQIGTTWSGMVDSVWDELIRKSTETQQQLQHIAVQFMDGLNSSFARGMTGQKMNMSGVFLNASEGIAKSTLEKAEGSLIKSLGFGTKTKRTGASPDEALFVSIVGGSGIGGSGIAGTISGLKSANALGLGASSIATSTSRGLMGMLNDSDWAGKLFGGKLFGSGGVFSNLHFATGGDFPALAPIRVGEMGPETLSFPVPGHVTPANQTHGAGAFYSITVHGGDPELNKANFQDALAQVHGSAVSNAAAVQHEKEMRRPRKN